MNPQRPSSNPDPEDELTRIEPSSYPYPGDDFTRIDLTLAEEEAIRAGETERLKAWEPLNSEATARANQTAARIRALEPEMTEIVRDLNAKARNQRIEQELKRSEEDAWVLGTRFPRDIERLREDVPGIGRVVDSLAHKDPGEYEPMPWYGVLGPLAGPLKIEPPIAWYRAPTENVPRGGREQEVLAALTAAGREQTQVALKSSAALTEAAYGVDAFGTSAETSTVPVRHLTDGAAGLGEQFGGFNSLVEATPAHIAEVNAAFDATSQDQLPELIGQMGALEYQTLAAVDAFSQLAGAPHGSTRSGGASGGGRSARPQSAELQAFLDTPAPANLQEIYLDQFKQGHDMSGFHNAEHWWGKHLEHVAQLKAAGNAFAQGTAFAPGGMALVGEMGPELVNLPRGSQVIPNPRLGSEVTVNVTVEGSVVAERDLAQRIRQELIRTSRRTVDLGFVA